jgi:alpha-mannosidase
MDWISAGDNDICITVSSSVAAADWINPAQPGDRDLLQHVLLASRTSCHWEGNEYSQAGNHAYSHVLTSNKAGETDGSRISKQFNDPVKVIVNPEKSAKANLAEEMEFFSIDTDNVIVSAIKKAEDGDGIVVRLYDAEGKESEVNLRAYFSLGNLEKTSIIEENQVATGKIEIKPFGIETYRLHIKN